jgi:hypothetical protein
MIAAGNGAEERAEENCFETTRSSLSRPTASESEVGISFDLFPRVSTEDGWQPWGPSGLAPWRYPFGVFNLRASGRGRRVGGFAKGWFLRFNGAMVGSDLDL